MHTPLYTLVTVITCSKVSPSVTVYWDTRSMRTRRGSAGWVTHTCCSPGTRICTSLSPALTARSAYRV